MRLDPLISLIGVPLQLLNQSAKGSQEVLKYIEWMMLAYAGNEAAMAMLRLMLLSVLVFVLWWW